MMISNELLFAVESIAKQNPEGFTLDLRTMEFVSAGIVAAYKDTQHSFGRAGLHRCIEHALYNDGFIGGWLNPDGHMQYDSCKVFRDREKAIKFGKKNEQYSIFDLDAMQEIRL